MKTPPIEFVILPLTRDRMARHLPELMEMDQDTPGERWEEQHFRFDAPGKWECSRLIADKSGKAVGFGVTSIKSSGMHLHRLAIVRDLRGRGLGGQLIKALAAAAREHGIELITLKVAPSNARAIAFYERLGFRESERTLLNLGMGCPVAALLERRATTTAAGQTKQ